MRGIRHLKCILLEGPSEQIQWKQTNTFSIKYIHRPDTDTLPLIEKVVFEQIKIEIFLNSTAFGPILECLALDMSCVRGDKQLARILKYVFAAKKT